MKLTYESETIITRAIARLDQRIEELGFVGEGPQIGRLIGRYHDVAGRIERTHRASVADFNRNIPELAKLQRMVDRMERLTH